ncbi:hypothetical protein RQP46_009660 [Phenoliferia psychrophenolica]
MSHSPLVELPHSTSPTRRALARAREVPLSPGDGVIHFSRHRNKGTAFSRRETLILGGPIELGDENEAVAPSPAKLIRLSASPAQPAKRTATDLLLLSLDQPADATPLRRLKARENASASSSPATTPAPSPAQAASTKRAPSPSPAPALEQHDSAPLPDEGPQEFEQLAAFGETCDSSEDELLEEEASRPIEADAPQSDGDDGSDEDNVEDSGPDADLASPTFDAEQDEEVKLQVEPEPSTLLEVVTTQVDAVEVDPPQTPVAFAGEVEIADEVLEAEVEEDLLSLEPRDDSGHVLVKSEPAIELSSEDPPPATSELEIESEPLESPASPISRSPERARKALRVGETRAAAETVPVRLTSTSAIHPPPQRSFSNPALLPSSFPRSPSKTRLLAPTSLTSSLPTSSSTSSLLTAPAERLDTDVVLDVFRPLAAPLPRPKALAAPPPPAPPIAPVEALVEPLRATPLPRPTRKTLALAAAAHSASLLALNPLPPPPSPSIVSSQSTSTPAPTFNPIPTLTQEQWAQLTQRHTRKNKAHFNKLTVDELVIDQMRPPSPTSKIRKSVPEDGSGESREGRAKKRRTALRSSLGGSGDAEDDDDEVQVREEPRVVLAPVSHFRGAGDDEEYTSPVRGGKGKKKSVGDAAEARERRRVKWDKALVFEGPVRPHGESKPILKRVPLDKYGNSLITTGGFARPAAVTIVKRIYLDDE